MAMSLFRCPVAPHMGRMCWSLLVNNIFDRQTRTSLLLGQAVKFQWCILYVIFIGIHIGSPGELMLCSLSEMLRHGLHCRALYCPTCRVPFTSTRVSCAQPTRLAGQALWHIPHWPWAVGVSQQHSHAQPQTSLDAPVLERQAISCPPQCKRKYAVWFLRRT